MATRPIRLATLDEAAAARRTTQAQAERRGERRKHEDREQRRRPRRAEVRDQPPRDPGMEEQRDQGQEHRPHVGSDRSGLSTAAPAAYLTPAEPPTQSIAPELHSNNRIEETSMETFRSFVACAALCAVGAASAQQAPAEEPGWAKGRPKTDSRHEDGAGAGLPDPDRRPTSCRPRSSSCRRASRSRPGPRACSTRARSAPGRQGQRSSSARCSSATRSTRSREGQARAQGHHRQDADGRPASSSTQGQPVRRDEHEDHAATTTSRTSSTSPASPR